jgi:hypothetical protein
VFLFTHGVRLQQGDNSNEEDGDEDDDEGVCVCVCVCVCVRTVSLLNEVNAGEEEEEKDQDDDGLEDADEAADVRPLSFAVFCVFFSPSLCVQTGKRRARGRGAGPSQVRIMTIILPSIPLLAHFRFFFVFFNTAGAKEEASKLLRPRTSQSAVVRHLHRNTRAQHTSLDAPATCFSGFCGWARVHTRRLLLALGGRRRMVRSVAVQGWVLEIITVLIFK